jgi:prolipoprotein diacylglyceryltransferase
MNEPPYAIAVIAFCYPCRVGALSFQGVNGMADVLYLAIVMIFLGACLWYVKGADRL